MQDHKKTSFFGRGTHGEPMHRGAAPRVDLNALGVSVTKLPSIAGAVEGETLTSNQIIGAGAKCGAPVVPRWVQYSRTVLRFFAYFKEVR
jgi:hypothetical protein